MTTRVVPLPPPETIEPHAIPSDFVPARIGRLVVALPPSTPPDATWSRAERLMPFWAARNTSPPPRKSWWKRPKKRGLKPDHLPTQRVVRRAPLMEEGTSDKPLRKITL